MKHIPERTCIVCKAQKDKRELIRVVYAKDGAVALDPKGSAAGRGAYVCADGDCMHQAIAKKAFNRAFKTPLPQSTYDALKEEYDGLGDGR